MKLLIKENYFIFLVGFKYAPYIILIEDFFVILKGYVQRYS